MKILLLGNDKFVAEALVKRFLIEKNKILLAGSFDKSLDKNMLAKITYYDMNLTSDKLEDVFIVNSPDVVVHFNNCQTNFETSMKFVDSHEHINGMNNSHYYSVRGKISKYIYISTTKLEDAKDVKDDYWLNSHSVCEDLISKINTPETTKMVVLRVSQLYGLRQDERFCDICKLIKSKIYNTSIAEYELKTPQDYIYISDFANAVCRAVQSKGCDSFNIASGYKLSYEAIKEIVENIDRDNKDFINDNKLESVDITKTKEIVDVSLFTNIQTGIKEIYETKLAQSKEHEDLSFLAKIKKLGKALFKKGGLVIDSTPFFVNIALCLVVVYFSVYRNIPTLYGYIDLRLMYIIVIAILFGMRHAAFSIVLSIVLFVYQYSLSEESTILLLYNQDLVRDIFIIMIVGMITGYVRDKNNNKLNELLRTNVSLKEQLSHVKKMFYESLKVKDSLQDQVYNSSNSYGRVFSIISQLNSLEFTKLKFDIIKVAEEILENKSITLYMFNRNRTYLRLLSRSTGLGYCCNSIEIASNEVIKSVLETKKIYVNQNVKSKSDFMMVAPVVNGDDTIAIMAMHQAEIEDLTLSYVNLFSVTVSLINQAIVRAYTYEKAQEDRWYVKGTNILKDEIFSEKLAHHKKMKNERGISFAVLEIKNEVTQDLMEQAPYLVREFDYVGLSPEGKLRILFNNVNEEEVYKVRNRLSDKGIYTKMIDAE